MVEFQPSKLAVVGSNPIARSKEDVKRYSSFVKRGRDQDDRWLEERSTFDDSRVANDERWAHVAQLVEHVLGKDEVTRSIRVVGSITMLDPDREHTELARPRCAHD